MGRVVILTQSRLMVGAGEGLIKLVLLLVISVQRVSAPYIVRIGDGTDLHVLEITVSLSSGKDRRSKSPLES